MVRLDGQRHQRSTDEEVVERVVVLGQEPQQRRRFLRLVEFVETVRLSALNDLINKDTGF